LHVAAWPGEAEENFAVTGQASSSAGERDEQKAGPDPLRSRLCGQDFLIPRDRPWHGLFISGVVDYRPRIAHLEKHRATLIEAIKSGGLAAELGGELKQIMAELEQLKLVTQTRPAREAPRETVEQRVDDMREKLAQGGEVAQEVLRELFPGGIWLYPDPETGRFLWAVAQTAMPELQMLIGPDGRALTSAFPRVYDAIASEARQVEKAELVAGA